MKKYTLCLSLLLGFGLLASPGLPDDRDFVRTSAEDPYFFIIFDVSGSMNWTGSYAACSGGDCIAPMSGDDPLSKFHQAKRAIYEALEGAENVNFGFATYNQDSLRVTHKHFRYVAQNDGPSVSGSPNNFPRNRAVETFGPAFSPFCDNGGGDNNIGCYPNWPADVADSSDGYWERERVLRLPKPTPSNYFYIRTSNGTRYRIRYEMENGTQVGDDNIDVRVTRRRCTGSNNQCNNGGTESAIVRYRRQALTLPAPGPGEPPIFDEFLHWDNGVRRGPTQRGYFSQSQSSDMGVSNTCAGWDGNGDSSSDDYSGYNIRYPTVPGPDHATLTYGDVIPLSWSDNHKDDILSRFAPTPGIYGAAPYYEDFQTGGRNYLRLKDPNLRPTVPHGSTPLAKSMRDFRNWVDTWSTIAATNDPDFGCRQRYLLIITDGADTCGDANECTMATHLRNRGFLTYVIGFGLTGGPATSLNCIATNGGTGSPLLPQDGAALSAAITDILNQVKEASRSFASAAVPSVDASSDDAIYLTDFTPISTESTWNGRLDAFLKPLPLTPAGIPDRAVACSGGLTSRCHLWEAGTAMLTQAPTPAEVAGGNLRLGLSPTQRRVFYPHAIDYSLRLFEPPSNVLDWPPLLQDLGFANTNPAGPGVLPRARAIIEETLVQKHADIPIDPDNPLSPTIPIDYILGDVFHSDPAILQNPNDFNKFASNLFSTGDPCDLTVSSDRGYRCFAQKSRYRRKYVIAGANDGQLHFFNAGIVDTSTLQFDNGDGSEVFSYIPRMALPIIRDIAEANTHIYGVDGAVTLEDVYIHPRVGSAGVVDPTLREWRTVAVGGLREGGLKLGGDIVQMPEAASAFAEDVRTGYYALDITQPDPLTHQDDGTPAERFEPDTNPVPGCLVTDGVTIPAGCGPVPYPALLWEFLDVNPATGEPMDEDPVPNGHGDLGQPWSKPIVTGLQVIEGGNLVTKSVAIVGGGLDPHNKTSANPDQGNWIYMIDIETGEAIYKRRVLGSVPNLTALDRDIDGHVDTIYAGTTAGRLYKIDVSTPQPLATPATPPVDVLGIAHPSVSRVLASEWEPFAIFETHNHQPIYLPPRIIYEARVGKFAVGFGTGDRQDLWNEDGEPGRFYLILDDTYVASDVTLPFDETELYGFDPGDPPLLVAGAPPNLLSNPELVDVNNRPGWYLRWDPDERMITVPFAFSGVLIFNSFQPDILQVGTGGTVACARTGTTGNFLVLLENGNPLIDLDTSDADIDRVRRITGFIAAPYVEQTATANSDSGGSGGGGGGGAGGSGGGGGASGGTDCQTDPLLVAAAQQFRDRAPQGAKFGNYLFRLGMSSETGEQIGAACVPIAVNLRNWKEN